MGRLAEAEPCFPPGSAFTFGTTLHLCGAAVTLAQRLEKGGAVRSVAHSVTRGGYYWSSSTGLNTYLKRYRDPS